MKPNDQDSDGIAYKFIQLREESKKISENILVKYPIITKHLNLLSGFRNRITHDYDNVRYSFFEEILNNDIPVLKNILIEIIKEL